MTGAGLGLARFPYRHRYDTTSGASDTELCDGYASREWRGCRRERHRWLLAAENQFRCADDQVGLRELDVVIATRGANLWRRRRQRDHRQSWSTSNWNPRSLITSEKAMDVIEASMMPSMRRIRTVALANTYYL